MTDIHRRSLAAGAGLLLGAVTVQARAQQVASAAAPTFRVQPLAFNPEKIKGLSAKLLTSHHDNNYAGAVKRLTAIADQLGKLDLEQTPAFMLNGLKREELLAYNSTILHELYFNSIGDAPGQPSGLLGQAIARDFGGMDRWKTAFATIGKALGGGSGWVILAHSPRDRRLFITWAADHTMAPAGSVPLLALDMYEHAYHMDYGADAGGYVDAFMQAINWTNAENRYREAMRV
jgi:Fe-Mn family superoxide dismutase